MRGTDREGVGKTKGRESGRKGRVAPSARPQAGLKRRAQSPGKGCREAASSSLFRKKCMFRSTRNIPATRNRLIDDVRFRVMEMS